MRFDVMTLFPDLVSTVLGESIIGRAQKSGAMELHVFNIRDYAGNKHNRVDDTPYGGGKGMLMMAPPVYDCYQAVLEKQKACGFDGRRHVIYMSPTGKVLTQQRAAELAAEYDNLILLCGHYEGIDCRVIDEIVDEEISIGDYVLTGGEIPACILTDCVARLTPGVLADDECFEVESLSPENGGLLEYPQYTRPYEYHGVKVPDVLISGHHANVDAWRHQAAVERTEQKRPDLLKNHEKEMTPHGEKQ